MINFRYHVVSLTAIFLALAIGLIVGTAALNGPAADELHDQVSRLSSSNSQMRGRLNSLNAEVSQKEQFATQIAPELLAGKLQGRRVLLVSMQSSTSLVSNVETMLTTLAGAKISGQVEIEDKFVNPENNSELLSLAEQSLNTAAISGLPTNSDGVETSSALLDAVLTDHTPAVSAASRTAILKAYETEQYLSVKGDVTGPAEAVVFLAPQPYVDSNSSNENQDVVTIVGQFSKTTPIVVGSAGASGSGNVIGSVTGDASLTKSVSTVDNVDTPEGQVATVLALNERLVYNKGGHYGGSSSATSLVRKWPEE